MQIVFAVGIGLIMGSFLSVVLQRLPRGERGIAIGRSECPHCHHVLAWYDLIPLVSYAALRGRCRYCGQRISLLYPALELSVAGIFGIYAARYGIDYAWQVFDLALLLGLIALFFFDLRYMILPDRLVFPLAGVAIARLVVMHSPFIAHSISSALVFAALFGGLYWFSGGRWLGFGDVKLSLLIGSMFGIAAVGVTLLAVWAGAVWGAVLMVRGRATMKTALPFGSFWTAAAILTILWPYPAYVLTAKFLLR